MTHALRSFVTVLCVWQAATGFAQTFGPPVIDRPLNDLAFQITFISGHAAPVAGDIEAWSLWAGATGDVKLQMWRPVTGGFMLVGSNIVNVPVLGLNVIPIAAGRIAVEAGDVIGFRYNDAALGTRIIDYTPNAGGSYQWTNWPDPSTDVANGGIIQNSQLLGQNEQREYSLAATVTTVPEPATLVVLLGGCLGLAWRRRKRA